MPDGTRTSTGPRTGRPRGFDTETIMRNALDLFWRKGYRATTLKDLSSHLKLSQSSLYNAFGSKAEILTATLDRYEAAIDRAVMGPLDSSPEGLAAIRQFLDALVGWITQPGKPGCMVTNLMAEDGGTSASIKDRTRAYRRRVRASVRNGLARAYALGELGKLDGKDGGAERVLDERADLLMTLILGLSVAARSGAATQEVLGLLEGAQAEVASWHQPR